MAVVDELARCEHGRHELGAIDHGVKPAFQKADQVRSGIAFQADRLGIDATELLFGNVGVVALELLLGAQLHPEVGELALAALAMLAGSIFAAIDGALGAAPDVLAHTAIKLVLGLNSLCHSRPHCGPASEDASH